MWKDPIVEEVRRTREKLADEAGCDLREMFRRYREVRKNWKGKVAGKDQLQRQKAVSTNPSK
ncbi:MAG: hypothetical protein IT446_03245 [Phycisphaerales bacterium]|nr:hypothetical protein [Phycisphaerales bacterium]